MKRLCKVFYCIFATSEVTQFRTDLLCFLELVSLFLQCMIKKVLVHVKSVLKVKFPGKATSWHGDGLEVEGISSQALIFS